VLLLAFTTAYNVKELVSGYRSIDMHCIAVPVKFDRWLSISFLRKKQLFIKKRGGGQFFFKKVPILQKTLESQALGIKLKPRG
jgi:hypothetical protein